MSISNLKVKGFRGIKELELGEFKRLNIIIGRNNTCKSTILEALYLLFAASDERFGESLGEILSWRGWYGLQTLSDLFYTKRERTEMSGKVNAQEWKLELLLTGFEVHVEYAQLLEQKKFGEHKALKKKFTSPGFTEAETRAVNEEGKVAEPFVEEPGRGEIKHFEVQFISGSELARYGSIEEIYSYAYEVKAIERAINLLNEAYRDLKGISPVIKGNKWITHVETEWGVYPYYVMGDGFKDALLIALSASMLNNGILLIDSPEAFHHPSSLEVVTNALSEAVLKNEVQVFTATQSLEFIKLMLEKAKEREIETAVIFLRKKDEEIKPQIMSLEEAIEYLKTIGLDLRGG